MNILEAIVDDDIVPHRQIPRALSEVLVSKGEFELHKLLKRSLKVGLRVRFHFNDEAALGILRGLRRKP